MYLCTNHNKGPVAFDIATTEGAAQRHALLLRCGILAQKQLVAAYVLKGDKPAICIIEPDAGSAASEMITNARRSGAGYVLNREKHRITGGGASKRT